MDSQNEDKLQSLIFRPERELVNIKFFPGTDRGLTPKQLSDTAADAIKSALDGGSQHHPPETGKQKVLLKDFGSA